MNKKNTDYERIIFKIRPAWNLLKKHPYQNTKGDDGSSIHSFKTNERDKIKRIKEQLFQKTYKFQPLRPTFRPKKTGGKRRLHIGTVSDRIVTKAILLVIGDRFNKLFDSKINYCPIIKSRKKSRNIQAAVSTIKQAYGKGYFWAFETDIAQFFDKIDKKKMEDLVRPHIDKNTFELIQQIIHFSAKKLDPKEFFDTNLGIAQGSSLSPLFANAYLNTFDKYLTDLKDVVVIRYVDDLVVMCRTKSRAEEIKSIVIKKLTLMGLELNSKKTDIFNLASKPLTFLGVQFTVSKTLKAYLPKEKLLEIIEDIKHILVARQSGHTISEKLLKVKRVLRANIKYYKSLDKDDFQPQLIQVIDEAQQAFINYFTYQQRRILNKDIYEGVDSSIRIEYLKFIGFDFSDLKIDTVLHSTQPSTAITAFDPR